MAKLSEEQREQVLARIARGASYEEAAQWCKRSLKIAISKQAIFKLVARHRTERADVSKAVARDHIAKQLPRDLVAADEHHHRAARLLEVAADAAEEEPSVANFEKYSKAAAVYLKFEELKRKTLGLDQPDAAFVDSVIDLAGLALAEEEAAARRAAFEAGEGEGEGEVDQAADAAGADRPPSSRRS